MQDEPAAKTTLSGKLGVSAIVFMVIAQAAPLTVMVANSPLIISMGNGAAAPADAAIAGLIMLLFAVGFVAMSRYIGSSGAFYAYVQKGLGKTMGLGTASLALLSYFSILIGLEAYIGYAGAEFIRATTGFTVPWQLLSLGTIAVVGFLGFRDVELSAKFLGVALVLEIAVVLVINWGVVARGTGGGELVPFNVDIFLSGSPGLGILFAIFSFAGFEATAVYREEARDPQVTIPRATYASVILIGLLYVVSMWCEVVGIGVHSVAAVATAHPGDMYQMLASQLFGPGFAQIMQVLLLTSLFACVLSIHNVLVRYKYVLGRQSVLHAALARVHSRHGSPHVASLVQTGMSVAGITLLGIFGGLDPVTQIYAWGATSGTVGYMAILLMTSLSIIVFFQRNPLDRRIWNVRIAPVLTLIGLFACLAIAIANLPSLIGGDTAKIAARVIIVVNVLTFGIGIGMAIVIRRRSPLRFARLSELA